MNDYSPVIQGVNMAALVFGLEFTHNSERGKHHHYINAGFGRGASHGV